MRPIIFLITILALATTADAREKSGVKLPDTVTVANKQLVLNGMGLREATFLKVNVYVAGLYVERPSSSPAELLSADESKVLVLRFVRDVDREDIVKAWSEGFKNNATVPLAQIKPRTDRLNAWMPAFNKGDTLVFTYVPGQGVGVDINGKRKGIIEGDDFARSLYAIWLGPKPPTSALKRGLLGNHRRSAS